MTLGFEDLLAMRIPATKIKAGVVLRCRRRLGYLVQQAVSERNPGVAKQAYDEAEALPQTATEDKLKIEGYELNGEFCAVNHNNIMCWKGTVPCLLKTLTEKEFNRGKVFLEALGGREIENLTTFEIALYESKRFMIMPYNLQLKPYNPSCSPQTPGKSIFLFTASASSSAATPTVPVALYGSKRQVRFVSLG